MPKQTSTRKPLAYSKFGKKAGGKMRSLRAKVAANRRWGKK